MSVPDAMHDAARARTAVSERPALDLATVLFVIILLGSMAARIGALQANPIGLYFDEAQYWAWSRSLDWGYFTKPPMIAWAIRATTAWFGDAEWAVRLAAPLAHGVTAGAIYALTRAIYGGWAGFWAGLAWLVMPAVWFSSALISTDALLLPFWALALVFLYRLMATRAWTWAALTGLCIGLGLMAKYTMLYFPVCMALAALWLAPLRAALAGGRAWLIGAIALAVAAPNLVWNAQHGFVTFGHTADNVNLGAALFNLDELGEFVGSQFMLAGPLLFLALLALLWRAARKTPSPDETFLLAFILPPLAVVTTLAFITRAHGNWAVAAYVAATVLTVGSLWRGAFGRRWLLAGLALNAAIGAALIAVALNADLASRFRGLRDARAWDETARLIGASAAAQGPISAVLVDDRTTFYELNYYWTRDGGAGAPAPLRMWLLHDHARNAAEATAPMRANVGVHVLVVHLSPHYYDFIADDFRTFRSVGELSVPLGRSRARAFTLSIGEGFEPVRRDAAFRARLEALRGRN